MNDRIDGLRASLPWPTSEPPLLGVLFTFPLLDGRAKCADEDPDSFFPEKSGNAREAKKVCEDCPVKAPCLAWALEHGERHGIWGGLSSEERKKLGAKKPPKRRRDAAQCGTPSGYNRHRNAGEKACPSCTEANTRYHNGWQSAKNRGVAS